MICWYLAVAFISASLLAYQIILMRMFAITLWYHFAYMMVSIALLGFGASGTFITLFQRGLRKRLSQWCAVSALLSSFALVACVILSQRIAFDPYFLPWVKSESWHLLQLYLVLIVPFFFGAGSIGLSFLAAKERIGRMYAANLLGSAAGSVSAVVLLYVLPVERTLPIIAGLGFLAMILWAAREGRRAALLACLAGALGFFFLWQLEVDIRISPFKQLSYKENLADAITVARRTSPLGRIDVIRSSAFRYAPCSLAYQGTIPPQLDIIIDADSETPVTNFSGDWSKLEYLDYTTAALPFHLLGSPKVLVVGAGGGAEVLNALYHGARQVDAVELNPQVMKLVKEDFARFACYLYDHPKVRPIIAEGRGYIESTRETYDIIDIALLDSYSSAAGGVYALNESYLYTIESLRAFIRRLSPAGILAITRWVMETPPRDGIKMFASALEALERSRIFQPENHMIAVRTWQIATIIISPSPFSKDQIEKAKEFCKRRGIDFIYYPGINPEEVALFHQDRTYLEIAGELLFGDREGFYRDYIFNVRPATDDRPYFFRFFRLSTLPRLISELGRDAVPFIEWGYIILLATLAQAVLVGLVLIVVPLFFLRLRGEKKHRGKVFIYFACLGLAYMFLEMAFIQKLILFLSFPVYVAAVVLTGFLLFSGIGSFVSQRVMRRLGNLLFISAGIALIAVGYLLGLGFVFSACMGFPDWAKVIISLALIAPLAFLMGIPFPHGLAWVNRTSPALVPWAWAVNGYLSVVAATLAAVLAMNVGFRGVVLCALVCYLVAACLLHFERS